MKIIGLTGSIGMGKSTVAAMFRAFGVPVHDSDAAVHRLYSAGGAAVAPVEAAFPGVTVDGAIDRARLSKYVLNDPPALKRLEAIIHPLVAGESRRFREQGQAAGAPLVVMDVPLLFETGGDRNCDATVVVSAPPDVQRARVLLRPGMTAEKYDAIVAKQMPDAEKRRRATFVVPTGGSLDETRAAVADVIEKLTGSRPQSPA
jgi:dephospho-CoA kinase